MVESTIKSSIEPALQNLGFRLVRILFSGGKKTGGNKLQIMAEPIEDREMTVEDCEKISRHVATLLDVDDPISSAYVLEVSSPGVDRPLTRVEDFERFSGELAKITLRQMIDGRRRFAGRLSGLDENNGVIIETSFGRYVFDFENIETARIDPSEILQS